MSEHENIAAALVDALTDLTNVAKNHQANTGSYYGYSFLNIADLVAETRPILAEHGIVALTPVHEHDSGLACTVTLLHRSGERLDFGPLPFQAGKDAQSTGSWITYMRRYALLAALGMGAEDDDGAKARPRQQDREQPQRNGRQRPAKRDERTAYNDLIGHLIAEGVSEDDAVTTAGAVWVDTPPQITDGAVSDDEWERVKKEAESRLEVPA